MKCIVAADKKWGIGLKNKLLVHIPEDMKTFRNLTIGKVVILGRKTLETFPNGLPLQGRTNIIMSRNADFTAKDAIIAHSEEILCRNEGCLSVPREYADVDRFAVVTVEYLDKKGEKKTRTADGLLGMAIQHELDHLDGILFIDYLSKLKRDKLLHHLEKRRKKEAKEAE